MAKSKLFEAPKVLLPERAAEVEYAEVPGEEKEEVQEEQEVKEEIQDEGNEEAPVETAETSEEPTEEATEEGSEVDDELLRLAESHGFTASEAKSYAPELLMRTIAAIDKQAAEWGKSNRPQPAPIPDQKAEPTKKPEIKLPEKLKLNVKDDWDEDVAKTLTQINDHYDGVIRSQAEMLAAQDEQFKMLTDVVLSMHNSQTAQTGQQQAEEQTREERELDEFFAGLGDEFTDTYGKVPIRQLPEGSSQRAARVKFYEEFDGLRYAERMRNRQTSAKDLLERTRILLHPDKIKAAARKEIAGKLAARKSQQTPKPSGKKTAPLTGDEAAVKRWQPFSEKIGKILEQSAL